MIRPLHDQIFIKPDIPEKSAGGIVLISGDKRDHEKYNTHEGEVVAVGSGVLLKCGARRKLDIEVGERVMFTNHEEMHVGDEVFMVIQEADILGVMDV